ncbi:hypothetical protein BTO04_04970 [Polaribacter sp. SA4-10]|uniref:AAA family ATPase n=1 Tax=Polaribacter sp. SA4-10 TaxID=754397 RepID=UPI000B3C50FA|nr:AAA family ATPase [Polaribacter sp. SA4-10]ARV06093.1 hypothetical protein BTO04_04970 [Polaribacter sp. SA4-10]
MQNHFQYIKINQEQQNAANQINDFLESDTSIFILEGYAGTGKTTLIKGIVKFLENDRKPFNVMTSKGRAAKIYKRVCLLKLKQSLQCK